LARVATAAAGFALLAGAALPATSAAATTRPFQGSLGGFTEPDAVAVDEATGDIYVLDAGAETVSRFDSALQPAEFPALATNVIDGKAALFCETLCDDTPANGFAFNGAGRDQLAVDNSGNPLTGGDLYVADPQHRVVDVFAPSGTYLGQLTATGGSGPHLGEPCGVAVDPNGGVHVANGSRSEIDAYAPTSNPPTDSDFVSSIAFPGCQLAAGAAATAGDLFVIPNWGSVEEIEPGEAIHEVVPEAEGIAVDPTTGHLFVGSEGEAGEFDASGTEAASLVESFGQMRLETPQGIAVDAATSRVYVTDAATDRVDVYGPAAPIALPGVAAGPMTPLPNGRETLTGFVDAEGVSTHYYFEYGEADCAVASCASVPASQDGVIGKGSGPMRVAQTLSGLRPGTTYHYRLVAVNGAGTAETSDRTFTTATAAPAEQCPNAAIRAVQGRSASLPDCRAYELVSTFPAAGRNNADVFVNTQRIEAAAGGGAFEFSTFQATAEAAGGGVTTSYIAAREPGGGWAVHGISPPQPSEHAIALIFGSEAGYVGTFTPNLSKGFFTSLAPLNAEGPNVSEIFNLYLREDLFDPGAGTYRLLSDSFIRQELPEYEEYSPPVLVGTSSDLSHVFFESRRNLTPEAVGLPEGPRLYEWVNGQVRYAAMLPASEGGGPTFANGGQGNGHYNGGAVSADGGRCVFTVPTVELAGRAEGPLYLRDDHGTPDTADDTTVKVNASEKTNGSGPGGEDPAGEQPATFWGGSADLSQVFFTTTEALTDDAPSDEPGVAKLYRYDLDAPIGSRLTLLSVDRNPGDGISDGAEGVIGASADGSYVYFVGSNQLVAGRPTGLGPRIFVWHEGEIREVAPLGSSAEAKEVTGTVPWTEGFKGSRVSADGRHLAFLDSSSALVGAGQASACVGSSPCREVYAYSISSGGEEQLRCASCVEAGLTDSGEGSFNAKGGSGALVGFVSHSPYLNRALSADGRFVFFTSDEPLSPYDENEDPDAYEFDSRTGAVRLLSSGEKGTSSYFLDASEGGEDVFFATRSPLLHSDGNESVDVYDARVGGGLEEAEPVSTTPCGSTAACRQTAAAPAAEGLATVLAAPKAGKRSHRVHHRRRHRAKRHHRGRHHHRAEHAPGDRHGRGHHHG
jgi:hypothetical protein